MIGFALLVAAILASGYGIARALYRRYEADAPAVEIAAAGATIGVALWLAASWILALLHLLDRRALLVVALAFGIGGLVSLRTLPAVGRPATHALVAAIPILFWVAFALWRGAILPPLSHDALSYHLPKAVMIMRAAHVGPFDAPDPRLSGFPSNYELLLADVLLLTGEDHLTEWIGTISFLGMLLITAMAVRRWWGPGPQVSAAVLVCAASPLLLLHSVADKNDLLAGFFGAGALLWAAQWYARGGPIPAALAIVCIQIAVGTKLTAGCVAIGMAPFVMARLVRKWPGLRAVMKALIFSAAAFFVCGLWGFFASTTGPAAPQANPETVAGVARRAYGDWNNFLDLPYALWSVSIGAGARVPWRGAGWAWSRHDLYASHQGALSAFLVLLLPLTGWRYRREGTDALRRERMAAGIAALIAFAALLPIEYPERPAAIARYALFALPVLIAWTIAPLLAELDRSAFRKRGLSVVAVVAAVFVLEAVDIARFDTFAPIEYVRWIAANPGSRRIAFMPDRAVFRVDELAADDDVIAIHGGADTWIYPAYGRKLTREVIVLPRDPSKVAIPPRAKWVVIDRFSGIPTGATPPDRMLYDALRRDPAFQLVYEKRILNQAVFRRVGSWPGGEPRTGRGTMRQSMSRLLIPNRQSETTDSMTTEELQAEHESGIGAPRPEVSIVMPCLNEAETLATCIGKARAFLDRSGVAGEIVVADNGSTDGSLEIAAAHGARVVHVTDRGYGSALQGGIVGARGRYIIMGDADDSYDFASLDAFVDKLREGYDLVMGNRFRGGIRGGAMPPLHRYLGNPVLTGIGRLFFRSSVRDFHCGLRGFARDAFDRMQMRTTGMEFASEMVVKATLMGMRITEVPVTLSPDGRSRPPHLRSWRDGWRHLRFLLLYSPRWLFLYPGAALMLAGFATMVWLLPGPRIVGGVGFDVQTMLYGGMAVLLGFQAVVFAVFTKVFAINTGLLPIDRRIERITGLLTLESGLAIGTVLVVFGLGVSLVAVGVWGEQSFGLLDPSMTLRLIVPAIVALMLGCQTVLSSFFLSVLMLKRR